MKDFKDQTITLPFPKLTAATTMGMLLECAPGVQSRLMSMDLNDQFTAQGCACPTTEDMDNGNMDEFMYTLTLASLFHIATTFMEVTKSDNPGNAIAANQMMVQWKPFFENARAMSAKAEEAGQ